MSEIIQEEKKRKKIYVITVVIVVLITGIVISYIYKSQKKYVPPPTAPKVELTGNKDIAKESWIAQSATQIQAQQQEIDNLKKILSTIQEKNRAIQLPPGAPPLPLPSTKEQENIGIPSGNPNMPNLTKQYGNNTSYPPPPPSSVSLNTNVKAEKHVEKQLSNLIVVDENKSSSSNVDKKKEETNEPKETQRSDSYIPSGSFVKVVLLNGIDAPTGSKGKGSPYPVLLRVLNFAQLPNLWKGDIKECFMLGEAVGELSSERVHIRTNTLSCINKKGEVLEGSITGYVVGEDGKIGLSGRVITKQGAILARSLVAGFLQGVSQAFSQSANVLNITPTGNISSVDPSKTLQAGFGMGMSKATEDLAKFYIDLAKELFPVIEANAGRQVEVVLVNKTNLSKLSK